MNFSLPSKTFLRYPIYNWSDNYLKDNAIVNRALLSLHDRSLKITHTVPLKWIYLHICLVVYVIAAFWGIADAIWQTQINALYGNIFVSDEEAAFSNYRLWESLGFLVAFVTQVYMLSSSQFERRLEGRLWSLIAI